jgi:hypothetical protein
MRQKAAITGWGNKGKPLPDPDGQPTRKPERAESRRPEKAASASGRAKNPTRANYPGGNTP